MAKKIGEPELSRTIASTETLKLAEIHTLDVFYTPLEERFERITRLARRALKVPVAGVSLLSHEKQWFKSIAGWTVDELPLEKSLCTVTVQSGELVVVSDTQADPRYADHPLVRGQPRFRFYVGYPLIDKNNVTVGTFCAMDIRPRKISSEDLQSIRDLGTLAQCELLSEHLADAQAALTAKLGAARREAMIDPLTRLWNRRGATVLLRAALKQADHQHTELALGLLDLDKFKHINDTYGHQVGDEVLRKVARVLVGCMRGEDMICRPAGDEFLMIMTNTDRSQAARIVERVRRSVSEAPVQTRQGLMPVTVSAGYAIREAGDNASAENLFERADEALLKSKSDGRNRVRMAG